jgi:hypothetical protein
MKLSESHVSALTTSNLFYEGRTAAKRSVENWRTIPSLSPPKWLSKEVDNRRIAFSKDLGDLEASMRKGSKAEWIGSRGT